MDDEGTIYKFNLHDFFCRLLVQQLKEFPEKIVAEQLGRLLLSRMVLLDYTAQKKLLPFVLKPKGKSPSKRIIQKIRNEPS